jgi:hypothetical protein
MLWKAGSGLRALETGICVATQNLGRVLAAQSLERGACGVWKAGSGPQALGRELWNMGPGPQALARELWNMGSGTVALERLVLSTFMLMQIEPYTLHHCH